MSHQLYKRNESNIIYHIDRNINVYIHKCIYSTQEHSSLKKEITKYVLKHQGYKMLNICK